MIASFWICCMWNHSTDYEPHNCMTMLNVPYVIASVSNYSSSRVMCGIALLLLTRVERDVSLVNQKYIVMVRILSLVYSIYISKKSCIEKDCPHINSSCFIIHEIIRYYLFTKVIWKTRFLILVCFLYVMNFFKTPWWSFLKVPMVIWYMWKIFQLYLTVDFF